MIRQLGSGAFTVAAVVAIGGVIAFALIALLDAVSGVLP